jgi:prepilin-type N-terminal cleavage/methylation domain-containing protein
MISASTLRKPRGFTIVELLIVIVVIGILAVIVIASYQGVQRRAQNSVKYEAARSYVTAIRSYTTLNSSFPAMSQGSACLGIGYEIRVVGDTVGSCGGSDYTTKEDATFNNALTSIIASIPPASNLVVQKQDGNTFVGVTLTNWSGFMVNGVSHPYFIQYVLSGSNQDCRVPGLVQMNGGVWGDMSPATTQKNTFYDSISTTCVVSLDNF